MRTARRVAPTAIYTACMLVAAWFALGAPHVDAAARFFAGGTPTIADGQAVVTVLGWTVVAATGSAALASAVRTIGATRLSRQRSTQATLFLVAGMLILSLGTLHRSLPAFSMCCGGTPGAIQEAVQLAH